LKEHMVKKPLSKYLVADMLVL